MSTIDHRSRKTQSRGEASRKRLVDEATRLFGLYGYSSVTMREIGAAAGLDNSTIYRHFKNKQDLAAEVVRRVLLELVPIASRLTDGGEPGLDTLVDVAVEFSDYLWNHPDESRLLLSWMSTTGEERSGFSYSVRLSDEPEHMAAITIRAVEKWLAAAQSNGSIRKVDPIDAIVNILALTIVRPATSKYFLNSVDPNRSASDRQQAAKRELRATIRGAFAPTPRQKDGDN